MFEPGTILQHQHPESLRRHSLLEKNDVSSITKEGWVELNTWAGTH